MKWKNQLIYFVKTQIAPNVLWGYWRKRYIFLPWILVKRSLRFGGLIVSLSLIKCQAVNTNSYLNVCFQLHIYQSWQFLKVYSFIQWHILKLMPCWDLVFKTLIFPKPINYTCEQKEHFLSFCIMSVHSWIIIHWSSSSSAAAVQLPRLEIMASKEKWKSIIGLPLLPKQKKQTNKQIS